MEIKQLQTILGYSIEKILEKGVRAVIETLGEKGSVIHGNPSLGTGVAYTYDRSFTPRIEKTRIMAVRVKKVVEATGAGDAYRAGMIAKLLAGKTLKDACAFGAKIAALSVGSRGGQNYHIR